MMTSSNGNIFRVIGLCAGNSPVPVNSPHKGQWRGALMFSLICVWINGWVNNREAGDLRRYLGHYDVIVMCCVYCVSVSAEFVHILQGGFCSNPTDYGKRIIRICLNVTARNACNANRMHIEYAVWDEIGESQLQNDSKYVHTCIMFLVRYPRVKKVFMEWFIFIYIHYLTPFPKPHISDM